MRRRGDIRNYQEELGIQASRLLPRVEIRSLRMRICTSMSMECTLSRLQVIQEIFDESSDVERSHFAKPAAELVADSAEHTQANTAELMDGNSGNIVQGIPLDVGLLFSRSLCIIIFAARIFNVSSSVSLSIAKII